MKTCPHCGAQLDPMRGANLDDLLTLLGLVRDAMVFGQPHLAATVLTLLVEHKGNLGLRSRSYAAMLREREGEQEPPPVTRCIWCSPDGTPDPAHSPVDLSHDDRAALEMAATLLTAHERAGLANRLRALARSPQPPPAKPQPQPQPPPEQHAPGRPTDDVAAVALAVRALGDLDIYSLFLAAQSVKPSMLTAEVWRRAEQARHGQK